MLAWLAVVEGSGRFRRLAPVLGAVVLLAVLLHGWWQSRRVSVRQPRWAPQEPTDSTVSTDALSGEHTSMVDAAVSPTLPGAPPVRKGMARLDPLVDAIATITLEHPLTGDQVLAHLPPSRRAGSKPVLVEGTFVGPIENTAGAARQLTELVRVEGLGPDGDYSIHPANPNPTGDLS